MNFTKLLPFIGAAATGNVPALIALAAKTVGEVIGKEVPATASAIADAVSGATPEQRLALVNAEHAFAIRMQELGFANVEALAELRVRETESVNKTMQTEAASDHWPTYSWRPAIGFAFALHVLGYVILPLFHIVPPSLSPELYVAVGGILGVASWFRGKMQADPNIPTDNRG